MAFCFCRRLRLLTRVWGWKTAKYFISEGLPFSKQFLESHIGNDKIWICVALKKWDKLIWGSLSDVRKEKLSLHFPSLIIFFFFTLSLKSALLERYKKQKTLRCFFFSCSNTATQTLKKRLSFFKAPFSLKCHCTVGSTEASNCLLNYLCKETHCMSIFHQHTRLPFTSEVNTEDHKYCECVFPRMISLEALGIPASAASNA